MFAGNSSLENVGGVSIDSELFRMTYLAGLIFFPIQFLFIKLSLFYYRSYSDSVLVACLALLRRLASYITLDVSEKFVQNSLVDSFKEFRTSHESFV